MTEDELTDATLAEFGFTAVSNKELAELRAENARLRATLEAVEWIAFPAEHDEPGYCAWCKNHLGFAHKTACPRQAALRGGE